jgi:hypothetical protein
VLTVEQAIKIIDQSSLFEMEHDKTGVPLGQLIAVRVGNDTDPMAELLLGDERYWEPLANLRVSESHFAGIASQLNAAGMLLYLTESRNTILTNLNDDGIRLVKEICGDIRILEGNRAEG